MKSGDGSEVGPSGHWGLGVLLQTAEHPFQIPANAGAGTQESLEVEEHQHLFGSQHADGSMGCFMVRRDAAARGWTRRLFTCHSKIFTLPCGPSLALQFLPSTSDGGGPDLVSLRPLPQPRGCVDR